MPHYYVRVVLMEDGVGTISESSCSVNNDSWDHAPVTLGDLIASAKVAASCLKVPAESDADSGARVEVEV